MVSKSSIDKFVNHIFSFVFIFSSDTLWHDMMICVWGGLPGFFDADVCYFSCWEVREANECGGIRSLLRCCGQWLVHIYYGTDNSSQRDHRPQIVTLLVHFIRSAHLPKGDKEGVCVINMVTNCVKYPRFFLWVLSGAKLCTYTLFLLFSSAELLAELAVLLFYLQFGLMHLFPSIFFLMKRDSPLFPHYSTVWSLKHQGCFLFNPELWDSAPCSPG